MGTGAGVPTESAPSAGPSDGGAVSGNTIPADLAGAKASRGATVVYAQSVGMSLYNH